MQEKLLEVRYGSRKSFYKKAKTKFKDNKLILISYQTEVSYIKNNKAFILGKWSGTTTRHIKEFLKQNGFKVENSKQILKDYLKKEE